MKNIRLAVFVACLPAFAQSSVLDHINQQGLNQQGLNRQGLPNFQAVSEQVFRGGQPSEDGFRHLAAVGIKTVLDLRERDQRSLAEEKLVTRLGLRYVNVAMKGMHTPSELQISSALGVLNDSSAAPVFVHCQRGADRTGAVVACYRIGHDHWENRKALDEARHFGMSWYQTQLQKYVLGYRLAEPSSVAETLAAQ